MPECKITKKEMSLITRLYLIEGIPGVGKTTTARKKKEELEKSGITVMLYEEGMLHPADMAWQAYMTDEEYKEYIAACKRTWERTDQTIPFEKVVQAIEKQVRREDNHILFAYTKVEYPEDCYWENVSMVASKELGDGRSSLKTFEEIHLRRWREFCKEAMKSEQPQVYIFECAFLQNHIFELLGTYEMGKESIVAYMRRLIHTVQELEPTILYLKPDNLEAVIDQAARERRGPNGDWIDHITDWVEQCKYGKSHHLHGIKGVYEFCRLREEMDWYVLERLDVPVQVIHRKS